MHRPLRWLALLLALPLLLLAAAGLLLGRVELAPLAGRAASAWMGREVRLDSLRVTPGRRIGLRLEGLRLANLPGTEQPEMLTLGRLSAELDALSLLRGPLTLHQVEAEGLRLILERDGQGRKNWRFGDAAPEPGGSGRAGLPTVPEARLADLAIDFRTSGGTLLRTRLEQAALAAPETGSPILLTATGRYNDIPLRLEGRFADFARLRDEATPFPADLRLEAEETRLRFTGGMTDPLALDGATGRLALEAESLDTLLRIAGLDRAEKGTPALRLAGDFTHQGPRWHWEKLEGMLGEAGLSGRHLTLEEGGRGRPDRIDAALDFATLDLNRLLDRRPRGGTEADLSLAVDQAPDTLLQAELTAARLLFGGLDAREARIAAALTPGRVAVEALAFTWLGGRITAQGQVETGRIEAATTAEGVESEALRRLLGAAPLPLSGRLEGHFALQAPGATLRQAAAAAHGSAVVTMRGGTVQRRVLEIASLDLRSLFRAAEGSSPIACLLAVVDLRGAEAVLGPVRLRARDGTLAGHGLLDLRRRRMDLVLGSQPDTTGALALDIPVRISGPFDDPSVRPANWSAEGRAMLAAPNVVGRLLPALRPHARRSPCLE